MIRIQVLRKKSDKKIQETKIWTKIISGLSLLWAKRKNAYVVGKLMAGYGIQLCYVLITGDNNILADDAGKTRLQVVPDLKVLNNKSYNDMILVQ